jgi:cytochrome P450
MIEIAEPLDPVGAVVHPDPYPYYARLRRERPLYLDSGLGLWVAASRETVEAALSHPALRVRPPAEPVPRALAGTPAGEVFARLVRMTDGEFHSRHKPAVQQAVSRFTLADVALAAAMAALDLAARRDANAFLSALPVQAMARLLRVADGLLEATTRWVDEFVQGIAPQASAEAIARANQAAMELMAQGEARGLDAVQSANRIAMMQQALDATAGLVGNTVRLLQDRPELVARTPSLDTWRTIVAEVARWDAPVQNTRRFAVADLTLAGQSMGQGQGVLLLLGSANRDETLNRDPDAFDPNRVQRRSMSFGAGPHGCPGEAIAIEMAAAGLRALHAARPLHDLFGPCTGFRPLANARIPVFAEKTSAPFGPRVR